MRSPLRKSSGFTLIEVVVALAILSLILLATVSSLRTFANTQVSLDKLANRVDEVRTVSGFIRGLLANAIPGKRSGGGLTLGGSSSELGYFEGTLDSLAWKAPALFGEAYGGTLLFRLVKENGALMLYWQDPPRPNAQVDWNGKDSRVLVASLEEFSVDFRAEYEEEWSTEQWSGRGSPALVRVTIKAGGRYWPELIMAMQR